MSDPARISEHISYAEATSSATAKAYNIDNRPNEQQLANMRYVAENVFERVRNHFGKPIRITSFFRNEQVNKIVSGAGKSQHKTGEAIDMQATSGVTNAQLFHYIKNNLLFDQLIWEFGNDSEPAWIHVSLTKGTNRKQVLKAIKKGNGETDYLTWK